MRRPITSLFLLATATSVLLLSAGCTKKLTGAYSNSEVPHTVLFVQGPVDTVNHVVHLFWYGTESHGYIRGYDVRMVNPADTVAADSAWRFTTRTDSVLTVWTPSGYTAPTFYVRAVDNRGVVDPSPAKQLFQFRNTPPIVSLITKPSRFDRSDTTYASVTVTWSVSDPDGDASKVTTHVWLDRMSGPPILAQGTSLTVPSENFKINGEYVSGVRTLYIQGVDDGGLAGPIDQVSWYVRQPVAGARARLLIIDEQGLNDSPKAIVDSIYIRAARQSGVAPDQISYIWLAKSQPFKSSADIYQTMKLFESVVWFRGVQNAFASSISSVLFNYSEGIGQYLESGGKVYLESQNMVRIMSTEGALDAGFLRRYMNCDGVFQYRSPPDSSAQYSVNKFDVTDVTKGGKLCWGANSDTVTCSGTVSYVRAFQVRDASQVWMYAPSGNLSPSNAIPVPVGIRYVNPFGGVIVANTFPLVAGGGLAPGVTVAMGVMHELGLDVP